MLRKEGLNNRYVIIKPTTACNFSCEFCSAKNLNIPLHEHLPKVLEEYLYEYKPRSLIITGGEPLINPKSYFMELIEVMQKITEDYSISLTSNMILWEQNPEKYDYLFKNTHIGVITSFQYGDDRKDDMVYTESRFIQLFKKFYQYYQYPLPFIYVVNENNEKHVLRACKLAKDLNTRLKLNQQLPLGKSTIFYPKYKLLELYIKIIQAGYKEQLLSLDAIKNNQCPFPISYKYCKEGRVVYIDENEQLRIDFCEDKISTSENIEINNSTLFSKCYSCKMFSLCNGCSINKHFSETIKQIQCEWMKTHQKELECYELL